jgi:choline dehydrogenase
MPSGRVVGGSSAINTTVFLWPLRVDLDGWAAIAGPEWSYDACVPYLARIESDLDFPEPPHGRDGKIPVRRPPRDTWSPAALAYESACVRAGFPISPDHNARDASGVGPVPFNSRDGLRMSAALAYLRAARDRTNLVILDRATARRVVVARRRAAGVEIVRVGETSVVFADEVILSAGAVGSPHLLLLSGIGPAHEIAPFGIAPVADLPGVGRNLRNHPLAALSWRVSERYGSPVELPIPWQVQLRCTAPGSEDTLDACLGVAVLTKRTPDHEPRIGISALLMHAASAGTITLASADAGVQPAIDLAFLRDPSDGARMRAMIGLAIELGEGSDLADLRGALAQPDARDLASTDALDVWLRRNILTSHHPCGTARMGAAGDPAAVVDPHGRVHGLDGLRVVDASIMPDCPRVNINAATIMLAEKIADTIVNERASLDAVGASG